MSDEWQLIETAPKDGSLILGYDAKYQDDAKHAKFYSGAFRDDDGEFYRGSSYEVVCWIESERWQMVQVSGDNYKRRKVVDRSYWGRSQGFWQPTHWMPLPKPPLSLTEALPEAKNTL